MKSFKEYLAESYSIDQLENELVDMGYAIKKKTSKSIEVSVESNVNRVDELIKIAQKFDGTYNANSSSSSVGRTDLPNGMYILVKPIGGGSGAGSAVTDVVESAQCVYCAVVWNNKDFSKESFESVKGDFDIRSSIDEVSKIPARWADSCTITAEALHKKYGSKNYTFHHKSDWVSKMDSHWKKLNKLGGQFSNINKWSPADIYMLTTAGHQVDVTKTESMLELNTLLIEHLNSGDIVPVSLKQVDKTASITTKNVVPHRPTYEFVSSTVGKRDFMKSQDSFLMFNGGEIQFRTFGSTWQGEIKGKNANMGKISGGPINHIMKTHNAPLLSQQQITNRTPELVSEFYKFYKYLVTNSPLTKEEFESKVLEKPQAWWVSKFLSTQLVYEFEKHSDKDEIISAMISYAASESDLSGPYIKVS